MYLRLISFLPFVLISFRFTRPDHFLLENYLFGLPARLCSSYIAAIFPDSLAWSPANPNCYTLVSYHVPLLWCII